MQPVQSMRSSQIPLAYPYPPNSMNISPQFSYTSSPIASFRTLPLSPSLAPTSLSNMQQQMAQTTAQMATASPSLTQAFVSVRGVPTTATKSDLMTLFEPFGPVTHISLSGSQALIGTTQEAVNSMMIFFSNSPPRINNKFLTLHLVKQMPPTSNSSFSVPSSPASFRRGLSPQLSPQQYTKSISQTQQSMSQMGIPFPSIPSPSSMHSNNITTVNLPLSALNSNMVAAQPYPPVTSFIPMNIYDPSMNLNSNSYSPQLNPNTMTSASTMMNSQPLNNSSSQYYQGGFAYPTTSVVLVSNLPTTSQSTADFQGDECSVREDKSATAEYVSCLFTCDELFTLFGIYGDVLRVKILYHHPSSALIQLASPLHAEMCCQHLNHLTLYGKQITVTPSKYSEVEVPKSDSENMGRDRTPLTKEYLRSPAHRFRNVKNTNTSTYLRNLHPLSTVLHVSSIASTVSEDELRGMFSAECDPEDISIQFIDHSQHPPTPQSALHDASESNVSQKHSPVQVRKGRSFSISSETQEFPNDSEGSLSSPALSASSQSDSPTSSSILHPPQSPHSTTSSSIQQKQAFIRLPSLLSAVLALIRNHNKLVDGRYMRVSFARKEPTMMNPPMGQERTRRSSLPGNAYSVSSSQGQLKSNSTTNSSSLWKSSSLRSSTGSASVSSSPALPSRPRLGSNFSSNRDANSLSTTPTSNRLRPFIKADTFESFDTKLRENSSNKDKLSIDSPKENFEKSTNFIDERPLSASTLGEVITHATDELDRLVITEKETLDPTCTILASENRNSPKSDQVVSAEKNIYIAKP